MINLASFMVKTKKFEWEKKILTFSFLFFYTSINIFIKTQIAIW